MSSEIRWAVLRNQFPFGIGDLIGHVHAPDKPAALEQARSIHGSAVVVQSVASLKVNEREKPLPLPDPTRDRYGLKKRTKASFNGRRTHAPKVRGPHDPRGPRSKPLTENTDAP